MVNVTITLGNEVEESPRPKFSIEALFCLLGVLGGRMLYLLVPFLV